MSDPAPIRTTGIGSFPGTDMPDAIKISFAECPDLPYLPELPDRGAHAGLVGRATAWLSGLTVDLQPAGWRLTDAAGIDHRRARGMLRSDLDQLEEQAQGYTGVIKYAVAGPWTLAASLEKPRGDKVLSDHGARADVAQSLAEGISELITEIRRRLPDTTAILQLDEPMLPTVLAGGVPTSSGFSRHRAVEPSEVSGAVTAVVEVLRAVDTEVWLHCCADDVPARLLAGTGISLLALDLARATTTTWDALGPAMEDGLWLGAGALDPTATQTPDEVADRVLRPFRTLGLDPAVSARTVLTPGCGLAGQDRGTAVQSLRTLRTAAGIVTDQLAR